MATIEIPATQAIIDNAQPGDVLQLAPGQFTRAAGARWT